MMIEAPVYKNLIISPLKHFKRMQEDDVKETLLKHLNTGELTVVPDAWVPNDRAFVFDANGDWHMIILAGEDK